MSKLRGWAKNTVFLLAFAAVIFVAVVALVRQQSAIKNMQEEIDTKQNELEEIHLEVEGYERMLEFAQSNEYAEQQARSILGWVRDGEILFVDPNGTKSNDDKIAETNQEDEISPEAAPEEPESGLESETIE